MRSTDPDLEASCLRAFELPAGAKGLFGNHVQPTDTFGGGPATAPPERGAIRVS